VQARTPWQRVSQALPWYGFGIGVLIRLYRWLVLAVIAPETWTSILGTIAVGVVLMCGLATTHFASFSLRSWRWRAPLLGLCIGAGDAVTSLLLTLLHKERGGHALATLADWPGAAVTVVLTRVLVVSLFAAVLAVVVTALRKAEDALPE